MDVVVVAVVVVKSNFAGISPFIALGSAPGTGQLQQLLQYCSNII